MRFSKILVRNYEDIIRQKEKNITYSHTGEKKVNLGLGVRAFTWHRIDLWFSLHDLKSGSRQKQP